MANRTRFYFYAPTWDIPAEGPIKIGNVLRSIKNPETPLATVVPLSTIPIEKTDVVISHAELRQGRFTILTRFLDVLKFGGGVGWGNNAEALHSYERLVTNQFFPDEDYLQQCLDAPRVRRYLELSRSKKPVYVITGLKTVHGASAESRTSHSRGGHLKGGVDPTLPSGGVAAAVEMNADLSRDRSTGVAWGGSEPFVLAFRVQRVYAHEKTGEIRKQGDYKRGAFLGNETKGDVGDGSVFSVSKTEDPEDEGYGNIEVTEGDYEVVCAFAKEVAEREGSGQVE
ncbi:hypothetical protein GGTG_13517 [Gaeumannomyces tritici R3-111a-1]|uniref:Uncharacterized protein n=1 Tax=Gaeumannomyces tritici (strain R3-111a-1) TaxID=644352 RepID=J3PJ35_GAET3|nr:hypothetical protein GGTG_13517 [Gaeumannomyces tritici R3-111a-1]EJT68927.1 hypothetical protein GGTG_13517 [Gaeumannomyces tritici R3-111a-1]